VFPFTCGWARSVSRLHGGAALCTAVLLVALALPAAPSAAAQPVRIAPEADAASVVAGTAPGTSFRFEPGVHRVRTIRVRDGDRFEAAPGAVLSGAITLEGFVAEAGRWVRDGDYGRATGHGFCLPGHDGVRFTACRMPEEVFVDDVPLRRAETADAVGPDAFHVHYESGRLVIGLDPAGRRVELSLVASAFDGRAADVVIRGLVIEKFANHAQRGAIHGDDGEDWRIEDNTIRLNHGTGLRVGPGMRARGNRIHDNGQLGLGGKGDGVRVERNVIARNNRAGFDPTWEGGGIKLVLSAGVVVRHNCVFDNDGSGIWTDIGIHDAHVAGNRVFGNRRPGIHHEVSGSARILDNLVVGNGHGDDRWLWGAQILIQNARDTLVAGNTVVVGPDRGNGIGMVHQRRDDPPGAPNPTTGNLIRDNLVVHAGARGETGAVADAELAVLYEGGNRFDRNHYVVASAAERRWTWRGAARDWSGLRAAGHEADGTLVEHGGTLDGVYERFRSLPCGL